jgi:hypothetical protein
MTTATYVLEVDWSGDGDYGDSNENVTGDTIQINTASLGRSLGSPLTSRSSAGKLVATLRNDADLYSPSNTDGALTGNIIPGRLVRLRTTSPSSTILWTGYLDSVVPHISRRHGKTATLTALGPLGRLATKNSRIAMQTSRRTDQAIGDVLDDAGWGASDRNLDTGQTTMTRWWADDISCIEALREIEATEAGFIREEKDGDIAFESRHHRILDTTDVATYSDHASPASGAISMVAPVRQIDPNSLIFNEFTSQVRTFSVGSLAVLWTLIETGSSSPLIAAGESKVFVAIYPTDEDRASGNMAVDAWTTPASTTDFTANSASDGSATNLTSDFAVAVVKRAEAMKITVTNNNALTAGYLTKLQARGTPVSRSEPVELIAEDSTSQTAFGKRTYPRPTSARFVPNTLEAQGWCDYSLSIFKDPFSLIEIMFSANKDSDSMAEALRVAVSDRVTLQLDENAGFGQDGIHFVERVTHIIRSKTEHWVSLVLSDGLKYGGFWVLNTSKLSISTRLAY